MSLEKELVVASDEAILPKGTWVRLKAAIDNLKAEALQAKQLGNLDNIIQRLRQSGTSWFISLDKFEIVLSDNKLHNVSDR